MKSINKARQAEIEVALEDLGKAAGELERTVENYNAELDGLRQSVEEAQRKYNEAIHDVKELYNTIIGEGREYFEDRTERWQESETGLAYDGWLESLDEFVDQFNEIELDLPDDLEPEIIDTEQLDMHSNSPEDQ